MSVAEPSNNLRLLSPEESHLFDLYVDSECDFLAFRRASGLSSFEALEFLRSIPDHVAALDTHLAGAWHRFSISRKMSAVRVLEQIIAENRDNSVERRRAACAILRAIDPPRQRSSEASPRPTASRPSRVHQAPSPQHTRDPVPDAIADATPTDDAEISALIEQAFEADPAVSPDPVDSPQIGEPSAPAVARASLLRPPPGPRPTSGSSPVPAHQLIYDALLAGEDIDTIARRILARNLERSRHHPAHPAASRPPPLNHAPPRPPPS